MTQHNSPVRKVILAARRARQLARPSGYITHKGVPGRNRRGNAVTPFLVRACGRIEVSRSTHVLMPKPIPGENLIKRDDGSRIHPTKGARPKTAYELLIAR